MMPPKEYKYISVSYINALADGDDDFLKEFIGIYLSSIPGNMEKLEAAVAGGDSKQVLFWAHKLKGSFNFLGCTGPGEVFTLIEDYSRNGEQLEQIPGLLARVSLLAAAVTTELEELLGELRSKG